MLDEFSYFGCLNLVFFPNVSLFALRGNLELQSTYKMTAIITIFPLKSDDSFTLLTIFTTIYIGKSRGLIQRLIHHQ